MVIKNHNFVKSSLLNHKYEFECTESKYADIFLRTLNGFQLSPEDIYIAKKDIDYSQISFRCPRKTRLQIEYTFREALNLPALYLMDVDWHESSLELTCDDGYVIF